MLNHQRPGAEANEREGDCDIDSKDDQTRPHSDLEVLRCRHSSRPHEMSKPSVLAIAPPAVGERGRRYQLMKQSSLPTKPFGNPSRQPGIRRSTRDEQHIPGRL